MDGINTPKEVAQYIVWEANQQDADPILALAIASVESGFSPQAKNQKSTAYGPYQWLKGSWAKHCQGDRTNPTDNIKCGVEKIAKGELNHWTADPASVKMWLPLYQKVFIAWAKTLYPVH